MERRLSAILSSDVVGYSHAMGVDEAGTLETLKSHRRKVFDPKATKYGGRTIKLMGDGALMEFSSVVDAVTFAVEVQCTIAVLNSTRPEARCLKYRIGINLGDIIVEGDDIYGDGVNIAARLESLAEPGGICIARSVHTQVRGKLDLTFKDMGPQTVKNIAEPVPAYSVALDERAVALLPRSSAAPAPRPSHWVKRTVALAAILAAAVGFMVWQSSAPNFVPNELAGAVRVLPGKPSIAVLPFQNMSGDVAQTYFADGITEDIITDLSKLSSLFVISRNSSFQYRGDDIDPIKTGRELGVRYILEGSVRRSGNQLRVNAQLIDAQTAGHLWAERYDGTLDDIFALQDRLNARIVEALSVNLGADERAQLKSRGTNNFNAYDAYLKGQDSYLRQTPQDTARAIEKYKLALEIDPGYAPAATALAGAYFLTYRLFWGSTFGLPRSREARRQALHYVDLALTLDPQSARAYAVKAQLIYFVPPRRFEEAMAEARRAIALDPNSAWANLGLAKILIYGGEPERALKHLELAQRLDPASVVSIETQLAFAYFGMDRFAEAASHGEKARAAAPENLPIMLLLAATYQYLDEHGKAESAIERIHAIRRSQYKPKYSEYLLREDMTNLFFKRDEDTVRLHEGLIKAGILE